VERPRPPLRVDAAAERLVGEGIVAGAVEILVAEAALRGEGRDEHVHPLLGIEVAHDSLAAARCLHGGELGRADGHRRLLARLDLDVRLLGGAAAGDRPHGDPARKEQAESSPTHMIFVPRARRTARILGSAPAAGATLSNAFGRWILAPPKIS